jgi:signal transduction histidine kinase
MGNSAWHEPARERRWDRLTWGWTTKDGPTQVMAPEAAPNGSRTLTVSRVGAGEVQEATPGLRPALGGTTAERMALLAEVMRWNDTDRRRMVGDMHSRLAGPIIRALYAVRKVRTSTTAGAAVGAELAILEAVIEEAERELRAFMAAEQPVDDGGGLAAAIVDRAERFSRETGIVVRTTVIGNPDRLDGATRRAIVCIADEALLNVQKHAGASTVSLSLVAHGGAVLLRVEDDGRGMPCEPRTERGRGIGLGDIRQRVAALGGITRLGAGRTAGTKLRVWIDGDPS